MKKPPTVSELGGLRAILGYLGNLLIGVALVVAPFIINGGQSPFYPAKQFHPTVEIHDEAGILQRDYVKSELEKLTFRQSTHVVVVNLPKSKASKTRCGTMLALIPRMSHGSRGRTRGAGPIT